MKKKNEGRVGGDEPINPYSNLRILVQKGEKITKEGESAMYGTTLLHFINKNIITKG